MKQKMHRYIVSIKHPNGGTGTKHKQWDQFNCPLKLGGTVERAHA